MEIEIVKVEPGNKTEGQKTLIAQCRCLVDNPKIKDGKIEGNRSVEFPADMTEADFKQLVLDNFSDMARLETAPVKTDKHQFENMKINNHE